MEEKGFKPRKLLKIIPVLAIICVAAFLYMAIKMNLNLGKAENEIVENITKTVSNVVETPVVENKVEDIQVAPENKIVEDVGGEDSDNVYAQDKTAEAIKLVKNLYSNADNIVVMCDSILSTGEYVVSVKDKDSQSVKAFYKVNLETETITEML